MLDLVESALFFLMGPVVWAAGLVLFLRSPLPVARKITWSFVLLAAGVAAGLLLPFPSIREKFAIAMLLLPLLATADVVLMGSARGYSFWLRACGFEVCTVFAAAALTRIVFAALHLAP